MRNEARQSLFGSDSGKVWVFTGGTFAAGGFQENQGFRNSAGLFEEVVRWDMRGETVCGRERFVINTARRGFGVREIVRDFEERVGRYHPAAVVYLSGEEDRFLEEEERRMGLRELEALTEGIGAEFFLIEGMEDALDAANEALRMAGAVPSLVHKGDREKWKLVPVSQIRVEQKEGVESAAERRQTRGEALWLQPKRNGTLKLRPGAMRWLFLGDSITHGALHTYGYDSVPQSWEKYLRGDLGREDDVVINTGVSGATAREFLERLEVRYEPYADADVVVIMFGTNDCCFPGVIGIEDFREDLRRILAMARRHGSQVVLRVPQPQKPEAAERAKALVPFVEAVREVGRETGAILVDHFESFEEWRLHQPAIFEAYMADAVHPGARGQYQMFRELAYGTGLAREASMAALTYPIQ